MTQIIQTANAASSVLRLAQQVQSFNQEAVETSYADLGMYLQTGEASTDRIIEMDRQLALMKQSASDLENAIDDADSKGDDLFDLLNQRASQISDKATEREMKSLTAERRATYERGIDVARENTERVREAIQEYDDVLAELQIRAILEVADEYTQSVIELGRQSGQLHLEIQAALETSADVARSYTDDGEPTMEPALIDEAMDATMEEAIVD